MIDDSGRAIRGVKPVGRFRVSNLVFSFGYQIFRGVKLGCFRGVNPGYWFFGIDPSRLGRAELHVRSLGQFSSHPPRARRPRLSQPSACHRGHRPRLQHAESVWLGRCRTTRHRRNGSRMCPSTIWRLCAGSRGSGENSVAVNGVKTRNLSGFCLLMKRAVYEAIGGLDERFGIGFFDDDDDLAIRARLAGFELGVAQDLFVHHFGSRTFQGNGIDAGSSS